MKKTFFITLLFGFNLNAMAETLPPVQDPDMQYAEPMESGYQLAPMPLIEVLLPDNSEDKSAALFVLRLHAEYLKNYASHMKDLSNEEAQNVVVKSFTEATRTCLSSEKNVPDRIKKAAELSLEYLSKGDNPALLAQMEAYEDELEYLLGIPEHLPIILLMTQSGQGIITYLQDASPKKQPSLPELLLAAHAELQAQTKKIIAQGFCAKALYPECSEALFDLSGMTEDLSFEGDFSAEQKKFLQQVRAQMEAYEKASKGQAMGSDQRLKAIYEPLLKLKREGLSEQDKECLAKLEACYQAGIKAYQHKGEELAEEFEYSLEIELSMMIELIWMQNFTQIAYDYGSFGECVAFPLLYHVKNKK